MKVMILGYPSAADRFVLGLPKAIPLAHRYLLGYAACHLFPPDEDEFSRGINLSILPSDGHRIVAKKKIPDLENATKETRIALDAYDRKQPGDPRKGAKIIAEVLTGTGRCLGRKLPPRLALGNDAVKYIRGVMETNMKSLEEWADVVGTTDYE